MRSALRLIAILIAAAAFGSQAQAACPDRVGVAFGDTLTSIARACGVNVEALRQMNPGLTAENLRAGSHIRVPPPPLPSGRVERRRGAVETIPPLVRAPVASGRSTVILPREPQYRPVEPFRPMPPFSERGPYAPNTPFGRPGTGIHPFPPLQQN